MKKFLTLFLCVVTFCSYCLSASAMTVGGLPIDDSAQITNREKMLESKYRQSVGRKLRDDFVCSDDGLFIVSKNVKKTLVYT